MEYPLELRYKTTERDPLLTVADATGDLMLITNPTSYENGSAVLVYADAERTALRYTISPDWILDFSIQYHFTDQDGEMLGSVRRDG